MSQIAATGRPALPGRWSYVALGFALAAAAVWVLASIVDDALYTITGALGLVAFGLGFKARRVAKRTGARVWPATVAVGLGGLLGAAVIVASVVYGISHLVS